MRFQTPEHTVAASRARHLPPAQFEHDVTATPRRSRKKRARRAKRGASQQPTRQGTLSNLPRRNYILQLGKLVGIFLLLLVAPVQEPPKPALRAQKVITLGKWRPALRLDRPSYATGLTSETSTDEIPLPGSGQKISTSPLIAVDEISENWPIISRLDDGLWKPRPLFPRGDDKLILQPFTEPVYDWESKSEQKDPHLRWDRLAVAQTLTLGVGAYGFTRFNNIFGGVAQSFKIGNDWNKDHTLHFDELLHLQGGYRVTQAVSTMYRWAGVPRSTADWIGAGTAAVVMTSLEYIDGRRLNDMASYSDFTANFLGIGFALAKPRISLLHDFDLRLSYRTPMDPFRRSTVTKYDRMTHWLTYDLSRKWKLPLHLGLGYSVRNPWRPGVKAAYFFGVGISPSALFARVYPALAEPLSWLDLYHFGNQVQLNDVPPAPTRTRRKH